MYRHSTNMTTGTLFLTRTDVASLLDLGDCIAAVERAFRELGAGRVRAPGALAHQVDDGGFHVKVASLPGKPAYFVAKTNGNFPQNRDRFGLPSVQGVIVLSDVENGRPLAVMDSIEITALRTAAATAVAARYLASPASRVAAIAGCGVQGRMQLRALRHVRQIDRVYAYDVSPDLARRYASEIASEMGIEVIPVSELAAGARHADVIITCTPSREPILRSADVRSGALVAGVGADAEHKQELDPQLLKQSAIVTDVLEQCARFGDLHHAIAAGVVRREDVRAELGEVVAGVKQGRRADDEIVVFDSTGTAVQDVAAAALVYERALQRVVGTRIEING